MQNEHNSCPYTRGDIGIGIPHAAFSEDRRYARTECRQQGGGDPTHISPLDDSRNRNAFSLVSIVLQLSIYSQAIYLDLRHFTSLRQSRHHASIPLVGLFVLALRF